MEQRCKTSSKHGSCVKLGGTFDAPVNIQAQLTSRMLFTFGVLPASCSTRLTHNNKGVVRCSKILCSGVVLRVEQVFSGQCQTAKGFIPNPYDRIKNPRQYSQHSEIARPFGILLIYI